MKKEWIARLMVALAFCLVGVLNILLVEHGMPAQTAYINEATCLVGFSIGSLFIR